MGRRQGQLDSPLTEDGRRHAESVADLCVALDADAVFSSPLGRARATADVVGSRFSLPVVVMSDLAEIDHGTFAGLTNEEIEARHPGELARRAQSRYTWSFPGGESYADADVRAGAALDAVVATGATSPVLVTHEMIGRMLLRTLLRLDTQDAFERSLSHGSVIEVWPAEARAVTHTV
jgi:broad specificity phosphatase PhoE